MLSTVEKVILLKKVPIFEHLGGEELISISDIAQEKDYKKNEIVFYEGTVGYELYIVINGSVEISRKMPDGTKKIVVHIGQYDYFGEMSLFEDSSHSATATAKEDTKSLVIPREGFIDICNEYPAIALEIIKIFSKRLRNTTKKL